MNKRPVYLCEMDWDIVTACLLDRIQRPGHVGPDAYTLWRAGANRARFIADKIAKGKRTSAQTQKGDL